MNIKSKSEVCLFKVYSLKFIIFFSTISLLTSCIFVPEESKNQDYADNCNMFSKELTLSAQEIKGHKCNSDAGACLMVYGVIVPVGSFVISGSIVVIGNTLHWLESIGSCST